MNYLHEYPKKVWLLLQNLIDLDTGSEIRLLSDHQFSGYSGNVRIPLEVINHIYDYIQLFSSPNLQ